eukprot:gene7126-7879_t
MGLTSSSSSEEEHWEQPSEKHEATLYYFAGRGLADQLRWLLAAGNTSFTQKIISQRMHFERMARRQLPFGQLPLLQIDGLELVQCQACLRYLARRAHIAGRTPEEVLKCDMIAEAIRDLLALLTTAPFDFVAGRFEAVLAANLRHRPSSSSSSTATATTPSSVHPIADIAAYNALPGQVFLVGKGLTYADVLAAHLTTWFVEECGPDLLKDKPLLVQLQNQVISLPGVKAFITSKLFYPIGDQTFCDQVRRVLDRPI